MIDAEVFFKSQVDQTIIAEPTVSANHCCEATLPRNNPYNARALASGIISV